MNNLIYLHILGLYLAPESSIGAALPLRPPQHDSLRANLYLYSKLLVPGLPLMVLMEPSAWYRNARVPFSEVISAQIKRLKQLREQLGT